MFYLDTPAKVIFVVLAYCGLAMLTWLAAAKFRFSSAARTCRGTTGSISNTIDVGALIQIIIHENIICATLDLFPTKFIVPTQT